MRYEQALLSQIKFKCQSRGIQLPAICNCRHGPSLSVLYLNISCSLDPWGTNPDTCANNCPFYRNAQGLHALRVALSAHIAQPITAPWRRCCTITDCFD